MAADLAAVIAPQDAVILGRTSYDEWSEFWPESEMTSTCTPASRRPGPCWPPRRWTKVRPVIAPVIALAIAGGGRRLLDGLAPMRLEWLRRSTSPRGYVPTDYRIRR